MPKFLLRYLAVVHRLTLVNALFLIAQIGHAQDFEVDYSLDVAGYYGNFQNNRFGTGEIVDLRNFEIGDEDTESAEAYIKPGLTFTYGSENSSSFYGGISGLATITRLDGDPGGSGQGDEDDVDFEDYYIGWRSADKLESGDSKLDFSIGGQPYSDVGYGTFLLYDATFDQYDDAAYWLAPRRAFSNSAILRYNHEKFNSQAFYLKAGPQFHENAELVGVNLDGTVLENVKAGISYLNFIDSDDVARTLDGMEVLTARTEFTPLPNFTVKGEYVKEFGDNNGTDINADGWYTELAYSMPDSKWTPSFRYRYSSFSGDSDPAGGDIETFDPLFYGYFYPGNWYQGEIAGSYLTFNSNQNTHMFYASVFPKSTVGLELVHYRFDLDEENYFGTPVSSKSLAKETDFYITFYPNEQLIWGLTFAKASPSAAAREAIGGDDDWYSFQIFALYSF